MIYRAELIAAAARRDAALAEARQLVASSQEVIAVRAELARVERENRHTRERIIVLQRRKARRGRVADALVLVFVFTLFAMLMSTSFIISK